MRIGVKLIFSVIVFAAMSVVAISKPIFQGRPVYYTGQVVSIDFNGDIRDFLEKIASISGFEIRMASEINRVVTLHIQDVPWDLALDTVLKNSGLSREGEGKSLRIAGADPLQGRESASGRNNNY